MSRRAAAWLAWSLVAVSLLIMALGLLLIFLGWSTPLPKGWHPWRYQAIDAFGLIGAPILGGLIASRRPKNPYGWLWIGFGLGFALVTFAQAYAAYALVVAAGSLPAPRTVSVLAESEGFAVAVALLPLLLLLFPDGRLPSQRWRFVAWSIIAVGSVVVICAPLLSEPANRRFVNPIGIEGAAGEAIGVLAFGGLYVLFGAIALSGLSLVLRYRRAAGVERQQIKWFAYAAVLFCGFLVLTSFLPDLLNSLLGSAAVLGLSASVGVAILKYRLYDIDLIINRTLVYGSLTAALVGVYFGGIVVLQSALRALTGQESTLAVVASTLAIAALFNPLRRRVQALVDRRFYRRKYDAAKTLAAFNTRLRDETELDTLSSDVVGVVRETMQPAHVSLWLREPERRLEDAGMHS
jgi:hypothetical protein